MPRQAPGLLDGDEPIERARARTEITARAFADAAGGYFERLKSYEDERAAAEERRERMRKAGIAAAVGGALLLVLGLALGGDAGLGLAALGVLGALLGGGYAYTQYTGAEERIEEAEANIEANEPDGSVSFVSQVTVPLYLVPFGDRHVVFDGLDQAPTRRLELANIDGAALHEAQQAFDSTYETYEDHLHGEGVLSPEAATEVVSDLAEHRELERPLVEQTRRMTEIAGAVEHETVVADVHADDRTTESVRALARAGLLSDADDLPAVETTRSMAESQAVVDTLKGVEEQARSGDVLDQAREHRERVAAALTETGNRLQANTSTVETHYEEHAGVTAASSEKRVCPRCLDARLESIDDELNLVDSILGEEGGALGRALSDDDLDKGTDEAFTDEIRDDIERELPHLATSLRRAYNSLPDLGGETGYCDTHERVETVAVPRSGRLFGEVWRSLYYRFREPIMESVADLERDAEDARQTKEQKRMDLTQYEQIKDDVQQRYFEVKSDYDAARELEKQLG